MAEQVQMSNNAGDASFINATAPVREMLRELPQIRILVERFSKHFKANFLKTEFARNGAPFAYTYLFLHPIQELADKFEIKREVLCFSDDSSSVDGRQFSYIDEILSKDRNRLVDDVIFVVSEAANLRDIADEYMERTGRKVVSCSWRDIQGAGDDYAYELLREFLYNRDFFDVSDPVSRDGQFFARFKLVDSIFDSLADGQSTGIFGLRKIGKTSVIKRLIVRNATSRKFRIAHIDAQSPLIYTNTPAGVALEICRSFNDLWGREHKVPFKKDIPKDANLLDATRYFTEFIRGLVAQGKPLLVIIDELERILPNKAVSSTWNTEYINLWRLLRSVSQQQQGKFVFLVASTNPYFIEAAKVTTEDNPIYRFIKPQYLNMFSRADLADMLIKLAKPMGITFVPDALDKIHEYFGGHPFLSRQLCSAIAADLPTRPLHVEKANVEKTIQQHAAGFKDDLDAILKVFSDFYPEEFDLLCKLGKDERGAIALLDAHPHIADHLLGYGLLLRTKNSFRFTMEALPPYLRMPRAKEYAVPEVPDKARERHLKLQAHMNSIEPAMRGQILAQLRAEFGKQWQAELALQESSAEKIERMGKLSAQEIMEETYLTDLVSTVSKHWKLFAKIFVSRDEFREHAAHLTGVARNVSDHRKYALCNDDAKYIRACEACEWFSDKLI